MTQENDECCTRVIFTETSFKNGVLLGLVEFYQSDKGVIGKCIGDVAVGSSGFTPCEGESVLPSIIAHDEVYNAAQNLMRTYFHVRSGNKDAYVWVVPHQSIQLDMTPEDEEEEAL